MSWRQILNIKGTDPWLMISGLGWNLLWTFFSITIAYLVLTRSQDMKTVVEVGLLATAFLGPFLGGWIIGRMAADNRGATYGIVGSFISVMVFLITGIPGGTVGLMTAVVALAGGLNGGLLSQDRPPR